MKKIPLGPFELYRPIGNGGMGEVWEGLHVPQQLPVAVKIMKSVPGRQEAYLEAFKNEVRAVSSLDHPSIIVVLDYGEVPVGSAKLSNGMIDPGSPFLVMELAKKGSLQRYRHSVGWHETKLVLFTVLDALAHSHAAGLIHRDLKPGNILVGCGTDSHRAGIKLTDFGLAQTFENFVDKNRAGWGTPQYMAPEQFRGAWRDYGPWTDLYALGVMAYQIVTGEFPFNARSNAGYARAHLLFEPEKIEPRFPIPEGFTGWVRRLIEKDPADRFQFAADAAWALQQLGDPDGFDTARQTVSVMPVSRGPVTDGVLTAQTLDGDPVFGTDVPDDDPTQMDRVPTTQLVFDSEEVARQTMSFSFPKAGGTAPNVAISMKREIPPMPYTWKRPLKPSSSTQLVGVGLGLFGLRRIRLVGRDDERTVLWDVLKESRTTGRPKIVILEGDAGTGKSRLARWLCQRAHEVGSARHLFANFSTQVSATTGLAAMLEKHFRIQELSVEERIERVMSLTATNDDVSAAVLAHYGLTRSPGAMYAQSIDFRMGTIVNHLNQMTRDRPVILWLDDAQWDTEALVLAAHIASREERLGPITVVMTVRSDLGFMSDDDAELYGLIKEWHDTTNIGVHPLMQDEAELLVRELLHLEPELAADVSNRSGGSPLFAVQLVSDWVEQGVLQFGRNGFQLDKNAEHSIPDNIHSLWLKRIDVLVGDDESNDRVALEIAAALGNHVNLDEWRRACKNGGVSLPARLLSRLYENGLATANKNEFGFCHGMFRESLVRTSRENGRWMDVNKACVGMLQVKYPKRRFPFDERYADHLIEAGFSQPAMAPLLRASSVRRSRGDFEMAHRLLDRHAKLARGMELGDETESTAERWVRRSRVLIEQGKYAQAMKYAEQALVESRKFSWGGVRPHAQLALATSMRFSGELSVALTLLEKAKAGFEQIDEPVRVAECLYGIGRVAFLRADSEVAITSLLASVDLFTEHGELSGIANCFNALGDVECDRMNLVRAEAWVAKAEAQFRVMANPIGLADCTNDRSVIARLRGDLEDALSLCEESLALYESDGAEQSMFVRINLGTILFAQREFAQARQIFDEIRVYFESSEQLGHLAEVSVFILGPLLQLGHYDVARKRVEEAARLLKKTGWRSGAIFRARDEIRDIVDEHEIEFPEIAALQSVLAD